MIKRSLLAVLVVVFLVYAPSLKNDFVNWDDPVHLTSNGLVRSLDFDHLKTIFTTAVNTTYVPLAILSFAFEYHFFGLNPFVYHLDNVLLHLGVTMLVFIFALRLGASLAAASMAALLFGIHPMHVESVVWVTARKDVLYGFLYMLALLCYQRYLVDKNVKMYVYTLVLGFLSVLAKPMALSLPLALFLLDWFNGRRDMPRMFKEKVPFFIYIFPIIWVTYSLNKDIVLTDHHSLKAILIFVWTLMFYIAKFVVPVLLVPYYALPQPVSLGNAQYGMSFLVLFLFFVCVIRYRKDRWVTFAFFFFLLLIFFLLRTANMLEGLVADRWMYLPSVGVCILVGVWLDRFRKILFKKGIFFRWIGCACFLLLVGFLSVRTIAQGQVWKDSVTLWTYIIRHSPPQYYFYLNRGNAFVNLKHYDWAIRDFNKALSINPELEEVYNDRGMVYFILERNALAMEDFNTALKINPRFPTGYNSRGGLYKFQGQYDLALADYNRAVALDPHFADAYNNRGVVYMIQGKDDLAIADFNMALDLMPDFADAYANRGLIRRLRKEYASALADYNNALSIQPSENIYVNLGNIYNALGQYDSAVASLSQALVLKPDNPDARRERAAAYVGLGQDDLAVPDLAMVIHLKPDDASAYFMRSVCYYHKRQYKEALDDVLKAKVLRYQIPQTYERELKDAVGF